jgi:SAM-dependent methyltransferase
MTQAAEYFQYSREELRPYLPAKSSRALEIGCGEGAFWKNFSYGPDHEVWGVEPNAQAAARAESKAHRVFNALFDDCHEKIPDEYFDLVVCNDVIEHMPDHDLFFRRIIEKMAPGAYLVGSLPNIRFYRTLRQLILRKDWSYTDSGVLDRTHLRFFTRKSMERAFHENGFVIEALGGINPPRAFKVSFILFNIMMLGSAWDSRYPQYAFRLRKP